MKRAGSKRLASRLKFIVPAAHCPILGELFRLIDVFVGMCDSADAGVHVFCGKSRWRNTRRPEAELVNDCAGVHRCDSRLPSWPLV